tara:strand:- start:22 stop:768 length:747 start_codon:yes stop_codon:yes gene_type:complete
MRRWKIALGFILISISLQAQQDFSSDRPGQTFSAAVLPKWGLQAQQGLEWRDFYDRQGEDQIVVNQRVLSSNTAIRLGLGNHIEVGLAYQMNGINNPTFDDGYRWEGQDPNLMLRFGLPGNGNSFQWAFIVQSSFSNLDYRLSAALNQGPWSVSGNLGFYHDEFTDYTAQWTVLLAYSKEYYSVFAEVYGLSLNSANRDYLAFDAGFSFKLSPRFQWELFAGNQVGVGPAVGLFSNYFVNTGFSWRIR